MPATTKKTTTATPKAETKKAEVAAPVVDEEKEALKKQLEELQAQMKMMAEMMATSKATPTVQSKANDRMITFINMTTGSAVLRGNSVHEIEGQFNSRKFFEREARVIVNNMRHTFEAGYVYIADADFVHECELEDAYSTLLSDKVLKELLNHDASYVVETYKNVSDGQKQIIVDMLESKKAHGEFVDANILIEIGKLANRDLINIEPEE